MYQNKLFFTILVIFLFLKNTSYAIENKILLKLNNQIITHYDVLNEIKYLSLLNPKINQLNNEEIYEISKNSVIREKIKTIEILNLRKKNESKNFSIRLEDEKLNIFIKQTYNSLGFRSYSDFESYIKKNEYDLELLKQKISLEILWNELIFFKYKNKVKISEEEIQKELLELKNNNPSLLLHEILIDFDDDINKKFELIKESIKKNGIENTASIYSKSDSSTTGGKIGWVNKLSLSPIIRKNISELNVGEFSKPIRIQSGFIVIFIKDKKIENESFDLNTEKKKLIEVKTNQQLNQFSNIYYNKIKKNIIINE